MQKQKIKLGIEDDKIFLVMNEWILCNIILQFCLSLQSTWCVIVMSFCLLPRYAARGDNNNLLTTHVDPEPTTSVRRQKEKEKSSKEKERNKLMGKFLGTDDSASATSCKLYKQVCGLLTSSMQKNWICKSASGSFRTKSTSCLSPSTLFSYCVGQPPHYSAIGSVFHQWRKFPV